MLVSSKLSLLLVCLLASQSASSVGIATGYWLDDRNSNSGRGNIFSLLHNVQTGSGAHPASSQWVPGAISARVKQLGREANH
jgi:hypothetical protein